MAEADYGTHAGAEPAGYAFGAGAFINFLGGVLSLALIAGVLVWGYQILVRDVSGVPVVMALDEPMRVAPENPGGRPADNQGLSVNEIAAEGLATEARDAVALAPEATMLSEEDVPSATLASITSEEVALEPSEAPEEVPTAVAMTPLEPAEPTDIEALLLTLVDAEEPLGALDVETTEVVASLAPVDLGEGVTRSLRPQARPAALNTTAQTLPAAPSLDLDPADIPAGTRLVQLGAYESPEVARAEWDRLDGRFGDYLEGKQRVIMQATKAGRTFYRLRAHGFGDVADARRFCSALVAQDADCIPVVQ